MQLEDLSFFWKFVERYLKVLLSINLFRALCLQSESIFGPHNHASCSSPQFFPGGGHFGKKGVWSNFFGMNKNFIQQSYAMFTCLDDEDGEA